MLLDGSGPKRYRMAGWAVGKIALTGAILVVLFRYVGVEAVLERVRSADPALVSLAVVIGVLQIALLAFRWHRILAALRTGHDVLPRPLQAQLVFWSAQFLSQVMPTLAGDGMRILIARGVGVTLRTGFKSTFTDRGLALLFLLVLAAIALVLAPSVVINSPIFRPLIYIVQAGIVLMIAVMAVSGRLVPLVARWPLLLVLVETLSSMRQVLSSPTGVLIGALYVLGHCMSIVIFLVLAHSQSVPLGIADVMVVVPLIVLISVVPVTVGGWGVREGVAVTLLGLYGVAPDVSLTLSISFGAVLLISALPGVLALLVLARRLHWRDAVRPQLHSRVQSRNEAT
jgi:uncharacterized membrane protein YbhN (UPF0104 family)